MKSIRVTFIFSLCLHVALVGVSSFFARKAKMQPTFYTVTLLQGSSEGKRGHHQPRDVTVRKVQKKIRPPVRKENPKIPKKDVAPETIKVPKIKETTSPSLKEKTKVKDKKVKIEDVASDYKEVQSAIAQIQQKEALKSVKESMKESIAEIQKKLDEKEKAEEKTTEPDQESEDFADERVRSSFQGYDSHEVELYRTQLWSLIHSRWSISEASIDRRKDLEVRIVMILSKDGSIRDVKIVQSSGDVMFDKSALSAINRVGHFPPFPPEIAMESEEVEVSFIPQEN